jgi:L-threonylcarbamoyladenylate synthase
MEVKGDRKKPMPVLVDNLAAAEKLAYLTDRARTLAREFWPGPLTMVLQSREVLPEILTPDKRVGLRSPKHPICLNLLKLCSGFLVGTSANLTGKSPARTAEEAFEQIGDRVDLVLDGGKAPLGVASTVVDLTQPKLKILREGPLDREQLLRSLRAHRPR